jgi:hypothetical protein
MNQSHKTNSPAHTPRSSRDRKRYAAFWKFLNSSFGLWVLSSVVLSGSIFLYKSYSLRLENLRATEDRISKLNTEVSYRLSLLNVAAENYPYYPGKSKEFLKSILYRDSSKFPAAVYTEFRESSLSELILQLAALAEANHKERLLKAAAAAQNIYAGIDFLESSGLFTEAREGSGFLGVLSKTLTVVARPIAQAQVLNKNLEPLNLPQWGCPLDSAFSSGAELLHSMTSDSSYLKRTIGGELPAFKYRITFSVSPDSKKVCVSPSSLENVLTSRSRPTR